MRWVFPPGIGEMLKEIASKSPLKKKLSRSAAFAKYRGPEWALFREALEGADAYLEFGCGLSTEYAASTGRLQIRSVETSKVWAEYLKTRRLANTEVIHVDIGEVGAWGRPLSYAKRNSFSQYFTAGFSDSFNPNVVLIDGRFRVACFLTAMLLSEPGTKIIFDDYVGRSKYHVVEEIFHPSKTSVRQALFIRPRHLNPDHVHGLLSSFSHVMD